MHRFGPKNRQAPWFEQRVCFGAGLAQQKRQVEPPQPGVQPGPQVELQVELQAEPRFEERPEAEQPAVLKQAPRVRD